MKIFLVQSKSRSTTCLTNSPNHQFGSSKSCSAFQRIQHENENKFKVLLAKCCLKAWKVKNRARMSDRCNKCLICPFRSIHCSSFCFTFCSPLDFPVFSLTSPFWIAMKRTNKREWRSEARTKRNWYSLKVFFASFLCLFFWFVPTATNRKIQHDERRGAWNVTVQENQSELNLQFIVVNF